MEKIKLQAFANGKIRCFGTHPDTFELVDENGNPISHGNPFSLCGCGKSKTKPICDGSHKEQTY